MAEFFRGWKRKLGVVVLAAACLFTVHWISRLCQPKFQYAKGTTKWSLELNSTHFGRVESFSLNEDGSFVRTVMQEGVPYWMICLPLTLISAWLLLSKPKTDIKLTHPVP